MRNAELATRAKEQRSADIPPVSERFYSVRGAYLVIQYETVQTINVEHLEALDED